MSKEREESGHGGNIGVYLDSKRRKFQDQMAGRVESETGSSPQIFQGLWFWVNGLTNPPLIELSPVIFRHGGKIIMHYNPSRVNFIIADRLPDSELKRIPYKCPIIKAQWIVDCIKNGNRISTENYLIQRLNCSPDNSITRFLTEIRHVEKSESNSSVQSDSAAQISNHGSRTKEVRSTLTDPDFVKNFFSSSRLHFIGSWKQNFEFLIHQYRNGTPLYGKPVKNCAFMNRVIVHIDMDCFFASVAMREDETLRNLPIAVSHSVSAGSGEISTANYIARGYGIRSGMFLKEALRLCPELIVVPYQFEKYQEVSEKIYSIFYRYTHCVEPVSCDEAYLEFAISDKESAYKDSSGFLILQNIAEVMKLVNQIRQEILESTRCPVSAGVSHNMFLARMATKKAKPNNISYFDPALAYNELKNTPLSDLPGIGWSMCKKLADLGILSGGDAQKLSLQKLTEILGSAKAKMLYDFCRGIDNRELKYDFGRKSIGVDVGWGVRFETEAQVFKFFTDLSEELSSRLLRLQTKAKCITLKIKKRHPDAPVEPSKFLGHGICENLSKSATVENPIDSASDIESLVRKSFKILNVKISDIRGVGFHASKLIAKNQCSKDTGYDFLNSWRVVKKKTDHPTSMKPLQSNFHAQTLVAVDHGKKSQLSETTMEQKSPTVETVTSTHQSSEDREGSSSPDSLYDLDKYQDLELPWKKSHDEKNHSKHSTRDVFSLGQCMDKIDYKTLRELPKSIQDEIRITFRLSDDEYSIEQESQKKSDLSPKVLHNLSTNSGQQQTSLLDQFKVIKAVKSNVSNRDARECRSVSGSRRTRKNDKSKRSGSSNSSNSKSAMKKSESIFSSGNIKYFNSCGKDAKTHADLKIDPNVLMELPISIRREVEREHLSHFRKTAFLTPAEAKSLTMPVSKPSLELSSANIHSFDNTEFSSRVNDLNSLKGLVDKLMDFLAQPEITSSEHPNKLATIRANEVFLNFSTAVCNEVDNYNLDDVYLVFKYFRRLCSQRTHLPWFKSLFNECLEFINLKLAKRYQQELHLLLERL